jgi:hypothetical protein
VVLGNNDNNQDDDTVASDIALLESESATAADGDTSVQDGDVETDDINLGGTRGVVYWPDTTIDETLTTEGELVLKTAQAFEANKDSGYWSYVFDKYNSPFALVTVEDDENGPDFNFELILKKIDDTWQVVYETSTVGETPPQAIIDTFAIPTVTE